MDRYQQVRTELGALALVCGVRTAKDGTRGYMRGTARIAGDHGGRPFALAAAHFAHLPHLPPGRFVLILGEHDSGAEARGAKFGGAAAAASSATLEEIPTSESQVRTCGARARACV